MSVPAGTRELKWDVRHRKKLLREDLGERVSPSGSLHSPYPRPSTGDLLFRDCGRLQSRRGIVSRGASGADDRRRLSVVPWRGIIVSPTRREADAGADLFCRRSERGGRRHAEGGRIRPPAGARELEVRGSVARDFPLALRGHTFGFVSDARLGRRSGDSPWPFKELNGQAPPRRSPIAREDQRRNRDVGGHVRSSRARWQRASALSSELEPKRSRAPSVRPEHGAVASTGFEWALERGRPVYRLPVARRQGEAAGRHPQRD